jgi:hypothetical protein
VYNFFNCDKFIGFLQGIKFLCSYLIRSTSAATRVW